MKREPVKFFITLVVITVTLVVVFTSSDNTPKEDNITSQVINIK